MTRQPPVLFVHGFIGSLDLAAPLLPHVAPHLRGYGEFRDADPGSISLPAQVEHLRGIVDAQWSGGPVDLVGHSVGGAIAMLFAHTHPERVRRIVNVEGNFTLDDAFWSASVGRMSQDEAEAMLARLRADPLAWLRGAIPDAPPHMAATAARWLDHQGAGTLRAMGRSVVDVTGDAGYPLMLREVLARHPVYLLAGERSRSGWNVPDWALTQCAGQATLAGCGHMLAAEQPEAFARTIRGFLSE